MTRNLSSWLIILVALLIGALWGIAFLKEMPAPLPYTEMDAHIRADIQALASLGWQHQLQATALFVAAPLLFLAGVMVRHGARLALVMCLAAGMYAVGSIIVVTHLDYPLILPSRTLVQAYCAVVALVPIFGILARKSAARA